MPAIYGLCYLYENQYVSLPLLNVRAEASIKELAAQVKLTQTYGNDATFPIEAKFSFPIPARAVVAAFCMVKQDGTKIIGSVLEKQEARQTYDTAVAQGQQASLMEQQTPDVFQVSVGNIPSKEQVQIELVYATELTEDEENDQIRFHLPVHIGLRYGNAPKSAPSIFTSTVFISPSSPTPFLNLLVNVEAIAPIAKISCPSHTVSTELGPDPKLPNFKELPFSNYARISLASDSALDKDFVLTIKSAGLDTPRCVAELHPSQDTVALGLTLVPRFKLPDLSRQEFVFLVDRSGSMNNNRIEAAKKALVVMLRALPHQDSLFQIASFGTRFSFLWEGGSKPYNQHTLEEATSHVDGMRADYGGTEIRNALEGCFNARKLDRPTSVLVLTDGDAWAIDGVLAVVKSAVARAPANAYLRVSVLGIGNSASTAMCEGIARAGNGTCMMVGEEETSFTGKIARMLKAARTPPILDISVDWGRPSTEEKNKKVVVAESKDDDFEMVEEPHEKEKPKKTLNIFDESYGDLIDSSTPALPPPPPPPVVLAPFAPIQQAPFKIYNLVPSIRLNIYAILQGKTVPKTVTIRGSTVDGAEIALPVNVTISNLPNVPGAPPAMHALAARKIIQDLEDGRHELASLISNPDDIDLLARTVKASIIRLGKAYSIASSHTSFVAVDESKPSEPVGQEVHALASTEGPVLVVAAVPPPPRARARVSLGHARLISETSAANESTIFRWGQSATESHARAHVASSIRPQFAGFAAPAPPAAPPPQAARGPPQALSDALSSALMPRSRGPTNNPLAGEDEEDDSSPPRANNIVRGKASSSAPGLTKRYRKSSGSLARVQPTNNAAIGAPATESDPLEALARLQAFDGAFSLGVLNVVKLATGIQTVRNAFPVGATDAVVATVLAMAFLSTKLRASVDRDAWEGLYDKAKQYVEVALSGMGVAESADELQAKVVGMLA